VIFTYTEFIKVVSYDVSTIIQGNIKRYVESSDSRQTWIDAYKEGVTQVINQVTMVKITGYV